MVMEAFIIFRLTEKQKEWLVRKARKLGFRSTGDFIRHRMLEDGERLGPEDPEVRRLLEKLDIHSERLVWNADQLVLDARHLRHSPHSADVPLLETSVVAVQESVSLLEELIREVFRAKKKMRDE